MNLTTLIFDLDGTISDPFEGISRSVNYALESLGLDAVETELIRPMIGPPLHEIFEFLTGDPDESLTDELIDKYRERYATIGYTENIIYEGIPEMISTLSGRGYKLGICTSKRADYATAIVEMFELDDFFAFVDGGGDGIHKHSQIEGLVAAGLLADSAIMIGDRNVDISAAKQNNLRSVGVSWGFAEHGELETAKPDFMAHSPDEILRLFE